MAKQTRVTVVLITKDRREEVLASLERLEALPEAPPVIVVDNASHDGTTASVRHHFPTAQVLRLDRNLGAAGRNLGVAAASTPYVAFCDDDSGWEPGALTRAAQTLDTYTGIGLLVARMLVGEERREDPINALMRHSPLPREPGLPGLPVLGFLACSAVVRRTAYLEARGFEERFCVGGEEELLALDMATLGWKLQYLDELKAYHLPSLSRDSHERRRRMVRNALWTAWLRRRGSGVARATSSVLRGGLADMHVWGGALEALRGLPWVLRERRRLPERVELARRQLEQAPPPGEPRAAP